MLGAPLVLVGALFLPHVWTLATAVALALPYPTWVRCFSPMLAVSCNLLGLVFPTRVYSSELLHHAGDSPVSLATWDAGQPAVAAPCKCLVLRARMLSQYFQLAAPCEAVCLLGRMNLVTVLLGAV